MDTPVGVSIRGLSELVWRITLDALSAAYRI
jgi:hypothetical protein